MAAFTKYVDPTDGIDDATAGRGDTAADPYATLDYAQGICATEDATEAHTIYIAPGIQEAPVEMDGGGASGSVFKIIGDPNLLQSWDSGVAPGPCVISAATSGVPTVVADTFAFDVNSNDYISIYDLTFEGGYYGVHGQNMANDNFIRCVAKGSQAAFRNCDGICDYCVGYAGGYVWWLASGVLNHCVAFSHGAGMQGNGVANNCIAIAPYAAFYQIEAKNCLALCGGHGVLQGAATGGSNIIMLCAEGMDGATYPTDNYIAFCGEACDADGINASTNHQAYCTTDNSDTDLMTLAKDFHFPDAMTIIKGISQAFKITGFRDYELAATNATTESFDIEGRARSMRDDGNTTANKIPPGPLTIPDVVIQGADEIRIRKMGEEIFYIPIEEDVDVTVTVTTAINGTGTMPTILLLEPDDDGGYNTGTPLDSDQAANNTITSLAVTGSPSARDKICILKLKTEDTAVGAYTDFSNITIS